MLAKAQLLQLQPEQLKARCKPGILTGAGTIRYSVLYLAGFLCLLVGLTALSAKEAQTVKIGRFSPKKYGDKPFFVTAKSSLKLPVTIFVNGPASVDNEGKVSIKGAGKVRIFAVQMGNDQFIPANPAEVTLEVAEASLVVRAEDKKMKEGEKTPELTVTYKGFVDGESVKNLTKPAVAKLVETGRGKRKNYKIVPSGSESMNYSFKYVSGSLEIIPEKKSIFGRN